MNINLYSPNIDNEMITFTLFDSINSVNTFLFGYSKTNANTDSWETRLISGYENNEQRKIVMNMAVIDEPQLGGSQDYFISCVRLPFIALSLIFNTRFSRPLCTVLVQHQNETQVWHVFSARKSLEPSSIRKIRGVTVCERGHEMFVRKELIRLRGNVPASFLNALGKNENKKKDIYLSYHVNPSVRINDEKVLIRTFRSAPL